MVTFALIKHSYSKSLRNKNQLTVFGARKEARMKVKVKNLHGTSDNFPWPYSSWLDFWRVHMDYSSFQKIYCAVHGFPELATLGAHVIKCDDPLDKNWYIVPVCAEVNAREDCYEVDEDLLVRVNS
jgi:hypothetical protein